MNNENQNEISKDEHPNTIEYLRLQNSIEKSKQEIISKMEKMNFTDEEKQEIMDIIEYHEILKNAAKTPLIKINENCVLDEVEDKVKENGKLIAENMLRVAREKMKKIIDRKLNK